MLEDNAPMYSCPQSRLNYFDTDIVVHTITIRRSRSHYLRMLIAYTHVGAREINRCHRAHLTQSSECR